MSPMYRNVLSPGSKNQRSPSLTNRRSFVGVTNETQPVSVPCAGSGPSLAIHGERAGANGAISLTMNALSLWSCCGITSLTSLESVSNASGEEVVFDTRISYDATSPKIPRKPTAGSGTSKAKTRCELRSRRTRYPGIRGDPRSPTDYVILVGSPACSRIPWRTWAFVATSAAAQGELSRPSLPIDDAVLDTTLPLSTRWGIVLWRIQPPTASCCFGDRAHTRASRVLAVV